jgi:anti-sigma regulatory factor (Ser/Thr protein kinase)
VARYLAGCPVADDATVIASELATNAAIHSASQGRFFTLRCEVHASHCRVEVEDLGGPWRRETGQDRPHGLDIVEALAGAGNWGVSGDSSGRAVWARLSW